ncbi:MAG: hypothetical protein IPL02_04165 [Moraxellaceae bacterium]|nr:hypothetical protein [Moraxellaceae bacterium]
MVQGDDVDSLDIFIKDLQTGQIERIATNGVLVSPNTELQFSPDGSLLMFSVESQIYQATVQTGVNVTPLQGNNVVFSSSGCLLLTKW